MSGLDRTSSSWPAAIGELVADKYRVERCLAVGGMGVVMLAEDVALKRRVAIKFVRADLADDAEAMGRFLQEARTAATLNGEHVVRILDSGWTSAGVPFLVMEYLDGRDLRTLLEQRGKLPSAIVVDYMLQVCEALAEAHGMGLAHLDLKPENLFLTEAPDGTEVIKVLDFGVARPLLSLGARSLEAMGTPEYMSPEQLLGDADIDWRSDVWSLAVVAVELVTGRTPFYDADPRNSIALVLRDPPVRLAQLSGMPEGLARALLTALSPVPQGRCRSVASFAQTLVPHGTDAARASANKVARIVARFGGEVVSTEFTTLNGVVRADTSEPEAPAPSRPRLSWWALAASVFVASGLGYAVAQRAPAVGGEAARAASVGAPEVESPLPSAPIARQPARPAPQAAAAPAPSTATARPPFSAKSPEPKATTKPLEPRVASKPPKVTTAPVEPKPRSAGSVLQEREPARPADLPLFEPSAPAESDEVIPPTL